jgi:hypothetical protein
MRRRPKAAIDIYIYSIDREIIKIFLYALVITLKLTLSETNIETIYY